MDYVVMIGQFVLSLSILIVLHEFGHFLPARLFGTRVEKFYLFFDFWLGSIFKFKRGETEYGIGWLPLGGYVKIAGMIDESNDKSFLEHEPQPWEFRSKKVWQRLIIMLGGVTVNFLLGIAIMIGVMAHYGEDYIPAKSVKEGIAVDSLGKLMGLRDGDMVLKVGDKEFTEFNDRLLKRDIVINGIESIEILRDGKTMQLPIPQDFSNELSRRANRNNALFGPRIPFVVIEVADTSAAKAAGVQKGDKLLTINNEPAGYMHLASKILSENASKPIQLQVLRGADTIALSATLGKEGKLGVKTDSVTNYLSFDHKSYSLGQAIPVGYNKAVGVLGDQISAFGQMFKGKIKVQESLGGFGTMSSMYGTVWNWQRFWTLTAMISMILAFMNLLPIPALDGGHVVFLMYEWVTGKKPSDKFMEYAGTVGFFLVLALLLVANGNDVLGCMKGQ